MVALFDFYIHDWVSCLDIEWITHGQVVRPESKTSSSSMRPISGPRSIQVPALLTLLDSLSQTQRVVHTFELVNVKLATVHGNCIHL